MIELIQRRLQSYRPENAVAEEQALKEIIQEVALYSLWRADLFELVAFQGGTSLRILHGLPRFSEDLDFILKVPDPDFDWQPYLGKLLSGLEEFGMAAEAIDKSRMDQRVKKAMLKDHSIGNQLDLTFYQGADHRKLKIKLEIDVNPPADSEFEYHYLDFPLDFEICTQDMSSNFALKIHALLCRRYVKGRDWYDFAWYVSRGTEINLRHLQNALIQFGPWQGEALEIDLEWVKRTLEDKIATIDWNEARQDVERFLGDTERASLKLWSGRFFFDKTSKLSGA